MKLNLEKVEGKALHAVQGGFRESLKALMARVLCPDSKDPKDNQSVRPNPVPVD